MLPQDRPLSPEERDQARKTYLEFLKKPGVTIQKLSRTLGEGFTPSVLSEFKRGDYGGDADRVARGLVAYIEAEAKRQESQVPIQFVYTDAARLMLAAVRMGYEHRRMVMITGGSGYGKTITAEAALALYTGSVYHRVSDTSCNGPPMIPALLEAMGVALPHGKAARYRELIRRLRGTDRIILLDEAHALTNKGRTIVRDIHDEAGVAIILFGTDKISAVAESDRVLGRGQWNSRFIRRLHLDSEEVSGGGKPLFTSAQIIEMFSKTELKLTSDGADMLSEIAMLPGQGALRIVRGIIETISMDRRLREQPVDARIVRGVLKETEPVIYAIVKARNLGAESGSKRKVRTA